jgi:hypothetical protein
MQTRMRLDSRAMKIFIQRKPEMGKSEHRKAGTKTLHGRGYENGQSFSENPKSGMKTEIQPVLPKNTAENQPDP